MATDIETLDVMDAAEKAHFFDNNPREYRKCSDEIYNLLFLHEVIATGINHDNLVLLQPNVQPDPDTLTAKTIMPVRRSTVTSSYETVLMYSFLDDPEFLARLQKENPALAEKNGEDIFRHLLKHNIGHILKGHVDMMSVPIAGQGFHYFIADPIAERFASRKRPILGISYCFN